MPHHHDAYDWLTLLIQVAVAAGTIGASWVALHLAGEERRRRAEADRLAAWRSARQVSGFARRYAVVSDFASGPCIEIANDSDDGIFNIRVQVFCLKDADLKWWWGSLVERNLEGDVILPRVAARHFERLPGVLAASEPAAISSNNNSGIPPHVDPAVDILVTIYWHDTNGEIWGRNSKTQQVQWYGRAVNP